MCLLKFGDHDHLVVDADILQGFPRIGCCIIKSRLKTELEVGQTAESPERGKDDR